MVSRPGGLAKPITYPKHEENSFSHKKDSYLFRPSLVAEEPSTRKQSKVRFQSYLDKGKDDDQYIVFSEQKRKSVVEVLSSPESESKSNGDTVNHE
jgi:hypothetical protein